MAVMAKQACTVFDFFFCSSPGILREPPFFARERETCGYLFCTCALWLEIASLKKKKKKKKKKEEDEAIFSKFVFSASIKLSHGHICTQEGQGFP